MSLSLREDGVSACAPLPDADVEEEEERRGVVSFLLFSSSEGFVEVGFKAGLSLAFEVEEVGEAGFDETSLGWRCSSVGYQSSKVSAVTSFRFEF